MNAGRQTSKQEVVLITGASSGFGKATASLLSQSGYAVFGTSRHPDENTSHDYEMLALDVRSDESVNAAVQSLMERTGRLDILINNAGYDLFGAVEETSLIEAKEQFETNFFGVVRMVKTALPIMRRQQSGLIINMGSLAGLISIPFHGFYSATKFALEGYTETLRHEVKRFNIRVSIIEPSFFKTNLAKSALCSDDSIEDYNDMRQRGQSFEKSVRAGDDPNRVAQLILSVMKSRSPRLRYRIGKQATLLPLLKAILSQAMFEAGSRRNFHLYGYKKT